MVQINFIFIHFSSHQIRTYLENNKIELRVSKWHGIMRLFHQLLHLFGYQTSPLESSKRHPYPHSASPKKERMSKVQRLRIILILSHTNPQPQQIFLRQSVKIAHWSYLYILFITFACLCPDIMTPQWMGIILNSPLSTTCKS